MTKNVIFYLPKDQRGNLNLQSGTNLRPAEMKKAFLKRGFQITEVSGSVATRKKKIKKILKNKELVNRSFLYVESANIPFMLSNYKHWPLSPIGDLWNFYCLSKKMKIGFFYRDIHWRYKNYCEITGRLKGTILKLLFYLEYFFLDKIFDYIFVPSDEFIEYFPPILKKAVYVNLPPGCIETESVFELPQKALIKCFYSGNINPYSTYDLTSVLKCFQLCPFAELTINTDKEYFEKYANYYNDYLQLKNVHITFDAYGEKVKEKQYTIAIVLFGLNGRTEITDIGMPIKIFHYLSLGLPILTDRNTPYGRLVEENHLGWTVESIDELQRILKKLVESPMLVMEAHKRVLKFASRNLWENRVNMIEQYLG